MGSNECGVSGMLRHAGRVAALIGMMLVAHTPGADGAPSLTTPAFPQPALDGRSSESSIASTHFVAGFSANTPERVANAASLGVNRDILYGGPPAASSALAQALRDGHMTVIDARISSELYYYECHRTHTVAPPPEGQPNTYCATDEEPGADASSVLAVIEEWLREDAADPLVSGYWVLDDWATSGRGHRP